MLILGVETTCDETGIAIVRDGHAILSNVVSSQIDMHAQYGGVVPELACRRHVDVCSPILDQALKASGIKIEEIDAVAVAHGPGLIGALLIGLNFAKGLALALDRPLVGVNHVEAHLYAAMMEAKVTFPALGVVLSGGHTHLLKINKLGDYKLIGKTHDDAVGEAFDKAASLLGLPYPGGPQIELLAKRGDPLRFPFKAGRIKLRPYDFSFSGLKTAVLYAVKGQNGDRNSLMQISCEEKCHIAASFQHAAVTDIVSKALTAAREMGCQSIILGGGVTGNQYLRDSLERESHIPIHWPPEGLSLDNAAMIAGLGYHLVQQAREDNVFNLEPLTRIPF